MWPYEETLSFIKDYEHAECLWNAENIDYKNRDKTADALAYIAHKYKMSLPAVNRKIAVLRFQYRRQYRKLEKFKKSGTSLNKGTWFAYEHLSFLMKYVEATERTFTMDDDLLPVKDEIVEISVEEEHSAGSTPRSWENSVKETDYETSVRPGGLQQSKVVNGNKRTRSMDKEKEDVKHLETLKETATKRDDFSIYGELIASKFRSSGRNNKEIAIAQYHIEQVCFNLIMGIYGNEYKRFYESQSSTPMPTSSSNLNDITIQEANSQLGTWMETLEHQSSHVDCGTTER